MSTLAQDPKPTARLEALDALRGIAALGVVFWHYQHFGGDPTQYPYFKTWGTSWMYARGWVLVDFFFLLSGIVFTFKYLAPVAEGKISGRDFMVLRFSRIYPLYLATLLFVAAVQWSRLALQRPTFLYGNNDAYHFVLNLLFLQSGWFESGFSYNNPAWSVASEMLVYVIFFAAARRAGPRYPIAAAVLTLLGMGIYKLEWTYPLFNGGTARAVMGFFGGSLIYMGVQRLVASGYGRWVAGLGLGFLAVVIAMVQQVGYDSFIGGTGFRIVPSHLFVIFAPILVCTLSAPLLARVLSIRPFTYLGDISYSVYLLHVPIQMAMLYVLEIQGRRAPSERVDFFWLFIAIMAVAAVLSHRYFELPVQSRLRKALLSRHERT